MRASAPPANQVVRLRFGCVWISDVHAGNILPATASVQTSAAAPGDTPTRAGVVGIASLTSGCFGATVTPHKRLLVDVWGGASDPAFSHDKNSPSIVWGLVLQPRLRLCPESRLAVAMRRLLQVLRQCDGAAGPGSQPKSLSGFEMGEAIAAKPLIAISL